MKNVLLLLTLLLFFSCSPGTKHEVKTIKVAGAERYADLVKYVTAGSGLFAYADVDKVYFFDSLNFEKKKDSLVISDTMWSVCVQSFLRAEGRKYENGQHPDSFGARISKQFPAINIEKVRFFEDSLLLVLLKLNYIVPAGKGIAPMAISPIFIYNIRTKSLSAYSIEAHTLHGYEREVARALAAFRQNGKIKLLYYGTKLDTSENTLSFTDAIEVLTFGDSVPELSIKPDTFPIISSISDGNFRLGLRNTVQYYNMRGEFQSEIKVPEENWRVSDVFKRGEDTWILCYRYTSGEPWQLAVFLDGKKEPVFRTEADVTALKFANWNDRYYLFYDKDLEVYAAEF